MAILDTLNKLLGDPNVKELKKLRPVIKQVRDFAARPEIRALTLESLPAKTAELKERIAALIATGVSEQDALNRFLPEAFAVAIRACELLKGQTARLGNQEFTWDMVPFDVQILGGTALHRGCIAEMRTGEGKTLVCTLPVYLNALLGKGVHVVTVNDYLARRDATWMGLLYRALGLTIGMVLHGQSSEQKREAYAADITYGTNNEYGFDYLRDNMAPAVHLQVQRGLQYAIVDEVDSILVDEARTPLIISAPAEESTGKYQQYAQLVSQLEENKHFTRDEKQRAAVLTEDGIAYMEKLLGLDNIYTEKGFEEVHHIEQALRAHAIYKRDVDYVVKDGEIIIVDEFTGRLMPGRRYSHGLHQAIEAKERVEVQRESRTLATITFQNYFRLYKKLAGMTGTAKTEEEEFESIYKLRTIVIPTNRSMIRQDRPDAVYRTVPAKFKAVAKIAQEKYKKGQPVLIGTTSIEKSEAMSMLLEREGVPHQVLNAKHHEKEAEIVSKAGQKGAVTIATNMAGRGTDIKLGEGVQELGGLCILGTERHEARRIDNQLRGRAGRQGDPGESQFFVSMEDELMRLFGGDRLKSMMERLQVPDDVPLENGLVSRSIEGAQKKVEGRNFDIRRHVLQYDDVMNKQRDIIYKRRQKVLEKIAESNHEQVSGVQVPWPLHEDIVSDLKREVQAIATAHAPEDDSETWNVEAIGENFSALHQGLQHVGHREHLRKFPGRVELVSYLEETVTKFYADKCAAADREAVARAEAIITLRSIDAFWMDHIDDMSHLREQVAFSGYAQRDPLIEYKDQGFQRFQLLISRIASSIVRGLLQADFAQFKAPVALAEQPIEQAMQTNEAQIAAELEHTGAAQPQAVLSSPAADSVDDISPFNSVRRFSANTPAPTASATRAGRNDPCPCGSGKKFKKCHGKDE